MWGYHNYPKCGELLVGDRPNNFLGIFCLHALQVITSYLFRSINPMITRTVVRAVAIKPITVDTLQTTTNSKSKYRVTAKAISLIINKNKSIY